MLGFAVRKDFKAYYNLEDKDLNELWEKAVFVFDTNVLLNQYRYEGETADFIFNIFEKLEGRIWIPYHVALEFHRNRLTVVREQLNRYSNVKAAIETGIGDTIKKIDALQLDKRHRHINPSEYTDALKGVESELVKKILAQEKEDGGHEVYRKLDQRIDHFFEGKSAFRQKIKSNSIPM